MDKCAQRRMYTACRGMCSQHTYRVICAVLTRSGIRCIYVFVFVNLCFNVEFVLFAVPTGRWQWCFVFVYLCTCVFVYLSFQCRVVVAVPT